MQMSDGTEKPFCEASCSSFCQPNELCSITGDGRCDVIAKLTAERDWMAHLLATIRDKGDIRFGAHRGLLAFSDLKDEAARSMTNAGHLAAADGGPNPT
jgi:hypothetical protein